MKPDIPERNSNYQVDGIEYKCESCGQVVAIQGEATIVRHSLCPSVGKDENHPRMYAVKPCGRVHPLPCGVDKECEGDE